VAKKDAGCITNYEPVKIYENTNTNSMVLDVIYGPEKPRIGCEIEWTINFKKAFSTDLWENQVHYDILKVNVIDGQTVPIASAADDEGHDKLFSASGQVHTYWLMQGDPGLQKFAVIVYGTGPVYSVPDPTKFGYVLFDVDLQSKKSVSGGLETLTPTPVESETSIPSWIKNNAGWWADGLIDDGSFVSGIQWLISNGVMNIPPTEQGTGTGCNVMPDWIKNNAGWWADGMIPDDAFVSGLQWLISNGIMKLTQETAEPKSEVKSVDLTISSSPILEKYFAKYVEVFGVPIYATSGVSDDKVLHAANVLAQYLDNDADGTPDNPLVVEKIKANNGGIPLFSEPDVDDDALYREPDRCWVALYEDETNPRNQFDASLEEILHMITQCGYAEAYPEIFGEHEDSLIAEYMDNARGGFFDQVPSSYPAGAWYSYDDYTCEYECMITEYFYWTMTSILGAQEDRFDEIGHEWKLNTKEKVMETDPDIYNLLTDPQYKLPTIIPDGNYQG